MNNVTRLAAPRDYRCEQTGFEVTVLFTSAAETLCALKTAASLAAGLNARITLIGVHVIPYPLPLERPPVYVEFLAERLQTVAVQSHVPAQIHLYFGRDLEAALVSVLNPDSALVIGAEDRRWPLRKRNLAKHLLKRGYQVVLAQPR